MNLQELFSMDDAAIEKVAARGFDVSENGHVLIKDSGAVTIGEKLAEVMLDENPRFDRVIREHGAAFARHLYLGVRFFAGPDWLEYLGDDPDADAAEVAEMSDGDALSWLRGEFELDEYDEEE